jgi:ATP-binding cassette subfamily B protein
VLTSLGAVLALALLGWWLAVVFVASVPLALLLARSHLRSTTDHVANYWRLIGELAARLLDAACGLRTIAATGTAEQETARVLRPLRALHACGAALWRHQANMVWRAALLVPTVQLSMLAVGGFAVLNGTLSTGALIAALGYAGLGMRVVGLMPLLTTVASARAAADRIAELLHTPVPAADTPPLSPGPGVVELRGVQVAGESGAAALREIDLVLPAGALVAVIGRADAGPSTLAAVVAGLVEPDRGAVLLDGVPLVRLRRDELRTAVGIAFARPTLLGCSVGEAIGYGRTSDDQSIRAAAVAAAVHDTVVRLPDGYATPLAAAPLSGGEAQRLGLARALVTQPRLLVLDDATASLDTVTEARIDEAIRTTLPGTTRLIVTHRLLTAERADLVVWLDNGALRGADTHPVLWRDPQYRAVFEQAPG